MSDDDKIKKVFELYGQLRSPIRVATRLEMDVDEVCKILEEEPEESSEKVAEVLRLYRRLRSPFQVARLTSLDVKEVWQIVEANLDKLSRRPVRYDGNGRPEISDFIVARRRVSDEGWDNSDPAIQQARADYEAGTHEMATGRDGPWLIMYAFPRKKPQPRPGYFKPVSY